MGGAIARKLLKVTLGIETNSFVSQIGKVKMEREFNDKMVNSIYKNEVRCPEIKTAKIMRENILDARKKGAIIPTMSIRMATARRSSRRVKPFGEQSVVCFRIRVFSISFK